MGKTQTANFKEWAKRFETGVDFRRFETYP